jgi:hypothetical protein
MLKIINLNLTSVHNTFMTISTARVLPLYPYTRCTSATIKDLHLCILKTWFLKVKRFIFYPQRISQATMHPNVTFIGLSKSRSSK